MTELKYIKEILNTGAGTEGSLLIPKTIMSTIIDEVEKNLIPRSEAAMYFGPAQIPGSSIDINYQDENTLSVRKIAEGGFIVLDNETYSSFNMKPEKYGVGIRITTEMQEDSMFPLLERNIRTAGKRFAEKETALIISDALDSAANTVSGGAAVTIGNITRAMQYLEDSDYKPTTFFVGNEVVTDLRNIDTFVEADKFGSRDMLVNGFIGVIFNMSVIRVSTNAGMTATSSYVTDRNNAYIISEKRPVTLTTFDLPNYDMRGATLTQRIKVRYFKTSAIAKITSS